jgi:hypothetical protein
MAEREKMGQLSLSRSHATISNGEDFLSRGDCVVVMHGEFLDLLIEDWEGFDVKTGELAYPSNFYPFLRTPRRTIS